MTIQNLIKTIIFRVLVFGNQHFKIIYKQYLYFFKIKEKKHLTFIYLLKQIFSKIISLKFEFKMSIANNTAILKF